MNALTAENRKLLENQEKIKSWYDLLQDIPDEKALFKSKVKSQDVDAFFKDVDVLKWAVIRIKHRAEEATCSIDKACADGGILDLSSRNLCDLTIKDFSRSLDSIWRIKLTGNFLRTLPAFCMTKPYLYSCIATGNIFNIQQELHDFRYNNRLHFDVLEIVKSLATSKSSKQEEFKKLYKDCASNLKRTPIENLADQAYRYISNNVKDVEKLKISSKVINGEIFGGVRCFFLLNPFVNLTSLDLSFCNLERRVPEDWLKPIKKLKFLNLSNTPIENLPESLQETSIEKLNIANTQIKNLPPWIGKLNKLKILNIGDTAIDSLPESFSHLILDTCYINGTKISRWPNFHEGIRYVSATGTSLEKVPIEAIDLLKNGDILVNETNAASLIMQKNIALKLNSKHLTVIIFASEVFKNNSKSIPSAIKTYVVGVEYILLISILGVFNLLQMLLLQAPVICVRRKNLNGKTYEKGEYLAFHMDPVKKTSGDMRAIGQILMQG